MIARLLARYRAWQDLRGFRRMLRRHEAWLEQSMEVLGRHDPKLAAHTAERILRRVHRNPGGIDQVRDVHDIMMTALLRGTGRAQKSPSLRRGS